MDGNKKQLTTWEAACIITGYGLGAGVLSMPYMAQRCGLPVAFLVLVLSLFASYALHMMIADLALKCGEGAQLISCLSRYLWRGKAKKPLTILFFVLMSGILFTNLAAYITGSADVIVGFFPGVPPLAAKLIFYALAAAVVLFGLKAVGVSESVAVTSIFALIAVLAGASFLHVRNPLPLSPGTPAEALAFFGLSMFAMSAFFSVPQAVEGLGGDVRKLRKAVFIGIFNNFILIVIITVCSLLASTEVTEVAMVGWSAGIGDWARVIGSVFTVLAMLTTYWSLSLALGGIVNDMMPLGDRGSWLFATAPSLLIALLGGADFLELMRTAGGLIAIMISVMVVPAYRNARNEEGGTLLPRGGTGLQIAVIAAYLLMAVGSVIPV